jgi:hypothetical protein
LEAAAEHRAVGFRHGLSYWLEGTVRVLLNLVVEETAMPEWLVQYVSEAKPESWTNAALAAARMHAEECLKISRELSKPDTVFSSQVMIARIDAAQGDAEASIEKLRTMLNEATDPDQLAELHYWLWKLDLDPDVDHRGKARTLYTELYKHTPKHEYRQRIDELENTYGQW